jgi:hypothetical protein
MRSAPYTPAMPRDGAIILCSRWRGPPGAATTMDAMEIDPKVCQFNYNLRAKGEPLVSIRHNPTGIVVRADGRAEVDVMVELAERIIAYDRARPAFSHFFGRFRGKP